MIFVLDCSVTMPWILKNDSSGYSVKILKSLEKKQAIVPKLWAYEVCNVIAVAERRKKIKSYEALNFFKILYELPIQFDDEETDIFYQIHPLTREFQLSSYDAAYLELAIRKKLPIATLDRAIQKASKKLGIKLV